MPDIELPAPLRLDPWATSSLLQKAIRRGEDALARRAGLTLYRQRGVAVFRRLCTIAVEDVGIADLDLVQEVTRIGADKALRAVLSSDTDLIDDLCARLAAATKDRSADYLYSAATKLEAALQERSKLKHFALADLISIAADPSILLMRRAVAALIACGSPIGEYLVPERVEQLLDALLIKQLPLHDAVLRLARIRSHPFCIMLPLLWSRWSHEGAEFKLVEGDLPKPEFWRNIPLYTFDIHTAAGKHAVTAFAHQNDRARSILAKYVQQHRWAEVTGVAAFYVDAAPVACRLDWPTGSLLSKAGFIADMSGAGCTVDGAEAVLECVRENVDHLNRLRRAAYLGRASSDQK